MAKSAKTSAVAIQSTVLTDKQVHDLNMMNKAAQNVKLGDMLKNGVGGGEGEPYVLPAATTSALGGVKQSAAVPEAAGENVTKAEFKALLDALKTAGIMANS